MAPGDPGEFRYCPLKVAGDVYCKGTRCAWFHHGKQRCAALVIASVMDTYLLGTEDVK